MTRILVDSNVWLDVLTEDPRWGAWSQEALQEAGSTAQLTINPIVYAEISVRFSRIEDLDAVLPRTVVRRESIPYQAAFLAGKVFLDYKRRGGRARSPLPDFFIGAHAAVAGYRLLTRDSKRYRSAFPTVPLIAP